MTVHIVPNLLVVGVEDMRAIDMDHDPRARIPFGMTIAGDVIPAFDDGDLMPILCQLAPDDGTAEACSDK